MFRILDRYVVREWLQILGVVLGATFGLLMLQALYDTFPDLRENRASTRDMLYYFAVLAPSHLSVVLPIGVLVSLLYTFSQLHRNNEIIAMRAAGIGLLRITRWVWVAAAALSVVLFHLNSTLIPWSVEQARLVLENIKFAHLESQTSDLDAIGVVGPVTYANRVEGRMWVMGGFSTYSHRGFSMVVSEIDDRRRERRRLLAQEGFWDAEKGHWTLLNGREIRFDPQTDYRDVLGRITPFQEREFAELHENPLWMIRLEKRPKDLSLYELDEILASPETAEHPRLLAYAVRYHSLLAGTLGCLIAAGLAVPFAVSGVRVNPAVGVSKSLGLFVVWWILAMLGNQLGEQATLSPAMAAWLPNIAMTGFAAFLLWRER